MHNMAMHGERLSTLCEAKLRQDDGSRWCCIRMKHGSRFDHQWAPDSGTGDTSKDFDPEGFHAGNGWWFKRLSEGSVMITHFQGDEHIMDAAVSLSGATWISVMAEMSIAPGWSGSHQHAQELHDPQ